MGSSIIFRVISRQHDAIAHALVHCQQCHILPASSMPASYSAMFQVSKRETSYMYAVQHSLSKRDQWVCARVEYAEEGTLLFSNRYTARAKSISMMQDKWWQ